MSCGGSDRQGLPAGPNGIPVLGAALKLKGPETILEWTKEYGPIFSLRIGPNLLVYLSNIKLVEEYMERKGSTLLGRPDGPAAIANGLLFGKGDEWRNNRSAFQKAMWKASLNEPYEAIICQEAKMVLDQLSSRLDTPLEIDTLLMPALTSRIITLLLGQPLPRDHEDVQLMVEQMRHLEEVDLTSKSTQVFLKLKGFRRPLEAVSGRTIPDMFKMSEVMQKLIRGWISRRREVMATSGGQPDPNSLIDQLLTSEEYANSKDEFNEEMIQSIMDLFNGGVTSSLSALEFFILYLIHHHNVQAKMKEEIRKNVEKGVAISWANRDLFPYTQATLIEVLRLASVTPSTLPHVATEDIMIEDQYEIPKDVFVMGSIYSMHRDPNYYHNPEEFSPARHLKGLEKVQRPKSYRPFGVGERLCMGYHLAEMEIFLIMAMMVNAYHLRAEHPDNPPPFDTLMRVVRRLKPFACVLEEWKDT